LPDFEAEVISVPGNCAQGHNAYILVSKNLNCNSGQNDLFSVLYNPIKEQENAIQDPKTKKIAIVKVFLAATRLTYRKHELCRTALFT
jgi:hypothetical protein